MGSFAFGNLFGLPGTPQFGDPGIAVPASSGSSDFQNFLSLAQLAGTDLLSYEALNQNRPSTLQILPNGQTIVSGGGASIPVSSSLGSIPGIVWIFIGIFLVVLLIRR